MVQPWFRRFIRAVEPASPRFHPCFSQVPLHHGPRVFGESLAGLPAGTGYGPRRRSPCRASATSSGSASRPHLADKFPLKEEVVVHNTCNPDTTLAPGTREWRWLADVTPKYVFRRAMTLWMKKHRQEDKDGVQSYPLETKCLSAGEFLEWKVCCCLVVC